MLESLLTKFELCDRWTLGDAADRDPPWFAAAAPAGFADDAPAEFAADAPAGNAAAPAGLVVLDAAAAFAAAVAVDVVA